MPEDAVHGWGNCRCYLGPRCPEGSLPYYGACKLVGFMPYAMTATLLPASIAMPATQCLYEGDACWQGSRRLARRWVFPC